MSEAPVHFEPPLALWLLKAVLLSVWALVSFGAMFFARQLQLNVLGWPLDFWVAAQGSVLVFIGIVAVYAGVANRCDVSAAGESEL